MITKLYMAILMQPDLPAAVAFYKKLGLQQVFYVSSKWAEFQLGETKIGLCPTPTEKPMQVRTGLVFEVDSIATFMENMKDAADFLGEPIEKPHGVMVSIKDPGGNIIDIYQPTPEKLKEFLAQQEAEQAQKGCCGKKSSCEDKEDDGQNCSA